MLQDMKAPPHRRADTATIILMILGVGFFIVYGWVATGGLGKFTSPDETVNFFFAQRFARGEPLRVPEPLNHIAGNMMYPRSASIAGGDIIPGSFYGVILLAGAVGRFFGSTAMLLLPPLLSAVAVYFFYRLLTGIFGRRIALLAAILLLFQPAFWYYSSRPMFHNILFVDLLILGSYFLLRFLKHGGWASALLWPFFIGLSLVMRTSELPWVAFLVAILLVAHWRQTPKAQLAAGGAVFFATVLPIFLYNIYLYGAAFSFGYSRPVISLASVGEFTASFGYKLSRIFFPVGIDLGNTLVMVDRYFLRYFSMYTILFVLGAAHFLLKLLTGNTSRQQRWYGFLFLAVMCWLFLYYGSGTYTEFGDADRAILSSSYIRYWLPVFVFMLPWCAIALTELGRLIQPRLRPAILCLVLAGTVLASAQLVLFDPLHGLITVRRIEREAAGISARVVEATEPSSVVFAGTADKIVFPQRKVIANFPNDEAAAQNNFRRLLARVPVYFFAVRSDDPTREREKTFERMGLTLMERLTLSENMVLYQVLP